jgi:uridine kinase
MKPIIIGLAGGTGSGKTIVARAILERVGPDRVAYIQHDSYYKDLSHLPPVDRPKVNFDCPDALETELLVKHLKELLGGNAVEVPVYDFKNHIRTNKTRHVEPKPVIIVEGILIFTDKRLREMMDVKIYVEADADIRFIRRLARDITERGRTVHSVINQYLTTVRPMHLKFVEPSKRHADLIIPKGGFNEVAIEIIVAKVKEWLANNKSVTKDRA